MRTLLAGAAVLTLCIAGENVSANLGSGTRRVFRDSDVRRIQQQRRNRSSSPTLKRSRQRSTTRQPKEKTPSVDRATSSERLLQQRIVEALQAEMLKNPGRAPSRKRVQEIVRQQIEQAKADGLIPADFDPGLQGDAGGLGKKSLFGGKGRSTRRSTGKSRSNRRRTGRSSRRKPRGKSAADALSIPGLTGGNSRGATPEQLQRQLQRLLK